MGESLLRYDTHNRDAMIITQSDLATLSACLEDVEIMAFFKTLF